MHECWPHCLSVLLLRHILLFITYRMLLPCYERCKWVASVNKRATMIVKNVWIHSIAASRWAFASLATIASNRWRRQLASGALVFVRFPSFFFRRPAANAKRDFLWMAKPNSASKFASGFRRAVIIWRAENRLSARVVWTKLVNFNVPETDWRKCRVVLQSVVLQLSTPVLFTWHCLIPRRFN